LGAYRDDFEAWLAANPSCLRRAAEPLPRFADRVGRMRELMGVLFGAGWARTGWPETHGGLGGTILHRAAMWDALARRGVSGMGLFEHLEILAPTLIALGPLEFTAQVLPDFLSGRATWAQGFSEPGAGSDLASLRTKAQRADAGYRIRGRKLWTSWASYATWCLVLARTGPADSRHRGITAFAVDMRAPGVEVRAIEQANGTDELAEVAFDDVFVPEERIVGAVDRGWDVAMHILSAERGTFAWFRHAFLYPRLLDGARLAEARSDAGFGDALLDLAAVSATSYNALVAQQSGATLGPRAAFAKLLLCAAERSVGDSLLEVADDLAVGAQDDATAVLRQEYLFSRIVTVYGGSEQMQLETIARRVLGLSG
jgi:alkylation response protein AidB-like acyl-CoA dehydrogenase